MVAPAWYCRSETKCSRLTVILHPAHRHSMTRELLLITVMALPSRRVVSGLTSISNYRNEWPPSRYRRRRLSLCGCSSNEKKTAHHSISRCRAILGNDGCSQHPNVIDVQVLAHRMREEVRKFVRKCDIPPKLVGILADRTVRNLPFYAHDDAETYSACIEETLEQDGIDYELKRCNANTSFDVESLIREMNNSNDVHGILVFYPIFKTPHSPRRRNNGSSEPYLNPSTGVYYKTPDDYLRDTVSPAKDVEAVGNMYNARWLFRARKQTLSDPYIPCTVQAVLKILETYHMPAQQSMSGPHALQESSRRWRGVTATVINRSEILGRPLAALMALQGANVYSVDASSVIHFTPGGRLRRSHYSLCDCLRESSVVVTAVPSTDFILPSSEIQEGTTVINVAEQSNVEEATLLNRPNVKLVPHVGSCTVAALEHNLIRLYKQQVGGR